MKKKSKILFAIITALAVFVLLFAAYVSDYYRADADAIAAFASAELVEQQLADENAIVYMPENPHTGLIFYPGGKVEYTSYAPLMQACAANGILCVLIKMPFNLAVLDINAAEGIQALYPDVENWYIGGHSLGGSMAASYLVENEESYDGLILLGSYSTADLSDTELNILCVYGSEDKVLNHQKYSKYKENLPDAFTELVLEGGCHAYFGMYGAQDGDGTPTLSNAEQINLTANAIADLVLP